MLFTRDPKSLTPICERNDYLKNLDENTNYIYQCKNYTTNQFGPACHTCYEGYVLSVDNTCILNTDLEGCHKAKNSNLCLECNDGLILVDSKCESPKIDNCEEYGNNEEPMHFTCHNCEKHS